jgi:hypothetical protein
VSDETPWYDARIGFPARDEKAAEDWLERALDLLPFPDFVARLELSESLSAGEGFGD